MYGALRSGLRASTQRPPARFIRCRRYPSPTRTRAFHSSRSLAQGPTPPADPDSKPANSHAADRKNEEGTAAQADAVDATEDAELLAQKLQRSREMTRRYSTALRRSQRRNRSQDLPPVVVPSWFYDECVRLNDEIPVNAPKRQFTLSLQRRGKDEIAKCSIPIHEQSAGVQLLFEFVSQAWGVSLIEDEARQEARQWALDSGLPDSEKVLLDLGEALRSDSRSWQLKHSKLDVERLEELLGQDEHKFDAVIESLNRARAGRGTFSDAIQALEQYRGSLSRLAAKTPHLPSVPSRLSPAHVPPFVDAEIRAIIAASLSTLNPAPSDSFPATKTNLILHCPSTGREKAIERHLALVARDQGADVVTLHAQDLAEIAGDYLGDLPEPSPHSIRSLAYETYRLGSDLENDAFLDEGGKDDYAEEQDDGATASWGFNPPGLRSRVPGRVMPISFVLPSALTNALKALQMPAEDASSSNEGQTRPQTQAETQLEDLKIANVLEQLIDTVRTKRNQRPPQPNINLPSHEEQEASAPGLGFFNSSMTSTGDNVNIDVALPKKAVSNYSLSVNTSSSPGKPVPSSNAKIIHVPDFKELNATHYGGRIIQKLEEIIRKRRTAGESIMIVGSTSSLDLTPELTRSGVQGLQSEGEAGVYRTIVVPVEKADDTHMTIGPRTSGPISREASKFRRVNVRHIFDMLRRLDSEASQHLSARESSDSTRSAPALASISFPSPGRILTYDEVHRIALTALGLHYVDAASTHVGGTHIALAIGLLQASDQCKFEYVKREASRPRSSDASPQSRATEKLEEGVNDAMRKAALSAMERTRQLERVAATATKHEKLLMPGIANPDQIKTTFDQIHVPKDTIESIRTLTSLSLLRPDAFNYGVLATEKISGALLYGPPGTGKTLLAKAVAKESGSTVLEVSGSQIMDKYVGEGEKNVTAIFSLARKLSPCIVFLDEADAIFSSRDVGRERTSHRDILNQFLKEWDGLNDLSVFVMVATNRPFDLDDAVIRRLPRRLLVDLPTQADRAAILKIHLRGEQLDDTVDLDDIAKRTPFYSGSDLKNLAVSAALSCVKEENETAALAAAAANQEASTSSSPSPSTSPSTQPTPNPPQPIRNPTYTFPSQRTLSQRHFDAALQDISASISENMSSLNAIKKFDEKYGDRRGKKARRVFGIGLDAGISESVVRVRP